jgi:hypothetical protein
MQVAPFIVSVLTTGSAAWLAGNDMWLPCWIAVAIALHNSRKVFQDTRSPFEYW